jgi:hypothetical protein
MWIGRFGHVVERKPNGRPGILYNDLVNTIRAQIPPGVKVITANPCSSRKGKLQQMGEQLALIPPDPHGAPAR